MSASCSLAASLDQPRTDINQISTEQNSHQRITDGHFYPVASVPSFEHVQNLSTKRTSPHKECINRTRNGQETDEKRTRKTEILLSISRPVVLSVDV